MNMPARPLALGNLRAFAAVARLLSFRAAAEELHLTQPAVSRQIQALEEELGVRLFARATRHVALTEAGVQLHHEVLPLMDRLDSCVASLRQQQQRPVIQVATFASLASLWLLPRLEAFQREHPNLDIRIAASDQVQDLRSQGLDLALTYQLGTPAGHAEKLFDEWLAPVHSPSRAARIASGELRPLQKPSDLSEHTLADEDDLRPSSQMVQWRQWLQHQGLPTLQARRWLRLNFTYQQVQAALSGQAVALGRLPLVDLHLARGELIETFGREARLAVPAAYWLRLAPGALARPGVAQCADWLRCEAAATNARCAAEPLTRCSAPARASAPRPPSSPRKSR